jgi:1-hydroxycarotenoid 3,4-desaturase
MAGPRVVIIGAGAGGLAAASDLAHAGLDVTVIDAADGEGGKMRQLEVDGRQIDAGPTVFTMRWVFDQLFATAGQDLAERLRMRPAGILARHAWRDGSRLDLHADPQVSAEAIAAFAGKSQAEAYRRFLDECRDIHTTLKPAFMSQEKPSPVELMMRVASPAALWRTRPFETFWRRLAGHFTDARLRQLFARYATYVGSSPFRAPATLMLIAHVEQDGVWLLEGGMKSLAQAMRQIGEAGGARFRLGVRAQEIIVRNSRIGGVRLSDGEEIPAEAVVFNGDASALACGLLGGHLRRAAPQVSPARRSLSAITWCHVSRTQGFDLDYHNVFFSDDYKDEFDAVFRRQSITAHPTVYICAQDRLNGARADDPERLLILINAPAIGDRPGGPFSPYTDFSGRVSDHLSACGLTIDRCLTEASITTPQDFNRLFPATGGALYGRANHGAFASFARSGSATPVGGLYLAGGSVHPGAGVPMATLSGRIAAGRLLADLQRPAKR